MSKSQGAKEYKKEKRSEYFSDCSYELDCNVILKVDTLSIIHLIEFGKSQKQIQESTVQMGEGVHTSCYLASNSMSHLA